MAGQGSQASVEEVRWGAGLCRAVSDTVCSGVVCHCVLSCGTAELTVVTVSCIVFLFSTLIFKEQKPRVERELMRKESYTRFLAAG